MLNDCHVQANAVISRQYAKRYADQGLISIALNPGAGAPSPLTSAYLNGCVAQVTSKQICNVMCICLLS